MHAPLACGRARAHAAAACAAACAPRAHPAASARPPPPRQARLVIARAVSNARQLQLRCDQQQRLIDAQRTFILGQQQPRPAACGGGGGGGCGASPAPSEEVGPGGACGGGRGQGAQWACGASAAARAPERAPRLEHAARAARPAGHGRRPRDAWRVRGLLLRRARHGAGVRPPGVRPLQRLVHRVPLLPLRGPAARAAVGMSPAPRAATRGRTPCCAPTKPNPAFCSVVKSSTPP
jgi:hypothetical protein